MSEKAKIVAVEACKVPPVMVTFQNATPQNPEDFSVHLARKPNGKSTTGQPLLIAASSDMIYSGQVTPNTLVDNYMVIRNKRTNRVRLVPYTSCSVISEHYTSVPLTLPSTEEDKLLLRHSIAKYGGKNAMRAQDRVSRMQINIDVIKDHLDQTISMSTEQMKREHKEEERLADIQDEGVEPPKNYDAKTVQEVYNVRQILTPDLVEELQEIAEQVLETKPSDLPITSDFLMDKFRAIQSSTTLTAAEKALTVKTIIYADALRNLILQSQTRKQLHRISMSEICESVEMYIRRAFADPKTGGSAMMSKYTRRKAICHYLIVAILLTAKLEVATEVIITELKLRKEELLDFARFLNLRTALNNTFIGLRMPKNKKDDDSKKIRLVKMGKKK